MRRIDKIVREAINELITESQTNDSFDSKENSFVSLDNDDNFEPMTYDYLIDRNNGLPDEYFEPTNILYDPNEIAMYEAPKELIHGKDDLNEGLIKTYPTKKSIEYVCKCLTKKGYTINPGFFKISCPNDNGTIYGHINLMIVLNYLNKDIDDTLKHEFNTCGYQLGTTFNRMDNQGNKCIVYQFEPKFQTDVTNSNFGQYLYHVTTENAANKIIHQGFCPSIRSKNIFKYDERCYFFTIYDKVLFSNYIKQANKQNVIGKNNINHNFKIITIDRNKLKNQDFFTDPNFDNKIAVFTYDNIPPSAIVKCENL